ncbi:hypothetical protein FKM82_025109 [Ascaphus truei]
MWGTEQPKDRILMGTSKLQRKAGPPASENHILKSFIPGQTKWLTDEQNGCLDPSAPSLSPPNPLFQPFTIGKGEKKH